MPNLEKWSDNATNEILFTCCIFINNEIYLNSILFNLLLLIIINPT